VPMHDTSANVEKAACSESSAEHPLRVLSFTMLLLLCRHQFGPDNIFFHKKYYLILCLLRWLPIAEIFHFHLFLKF
jgi:hypothetical protein